MSKSPNIYGYWISRDEVYEVGFEAHAEKAYELLHREYGVEPEVIWNSPYSVYQFMFKLGYVRVVNEWGDTHGVQIDRNAKPSRLQKEFIEDADHVDYCDIPETLVLEDYLPVKQLNLWEGVIHAEV